MEALGEEYPLDSTLLAKGESRPDLLSILVISLYGHPLREVLGVYIEEEEGEGLTSLELGEVLEVGY